MIREIRGCTFPTRGRKQAVRCNFLVLCEYASQLAGGGPVLAGIFRRVRTNEFPFQPGTFQVAAEVEVDPPEAGRKYLLDLVLSDEDGRELYSNQIEVSFARREDSGPSYCYFAGNVTLKQPFQRPGLYRFDLLHDGDSIGQVRLDVSN